MAKSLQERLTDAVQNITTLEVITRVGAVQITMADGNDLQVMLVVSNDQKESGAYTRIDLVDGDTLNHLSPEFVNGAYADLRAFHQQAVKDAQGLVDKRLELIERVAKWIAGELGEHLKQASNPPPGPGGGGNH